MAAVAAGLLLMAAAGIAATRPPPDADPPAGPAPVLAGTGQATPIPAGAAFFVRGLDTPRDRREQHSDILDTPILPGSVHKALTLVAALEADVIRPDSGAMCRRVVTVDGVRFVCAHPDLHRPLTPAEALAHSCNDFFVSLARRLPRERLNRVRLAAGLPPLPGSVKLGPALVGLEGPRVTPRALVDVLARLAGVGPDPAVPMRASTRAVLREGLAGAASYGTAAAIGAQGESALAKTGTAPMPGGGVAGVVVALAPADRPTRGVVVVAPGAAGADAASIAAALLSGADRSQAPARPNPVAAAAPAPTIRLGRTGRDGRTRVQVMDLDGYVAEVLAGEGQPRAGAAAQQALAITARTFAAANRNRHRAEGFDLCDTTHCQVVRPSTSTTRDAAAATAGQVLMDGAQPASVFYSAWCGGRLENASQVWEGAADFDHPDVDDACRDEPPWESDIRARDVERALAAAGLRGGRLRGLRVLQRNRSGRVVRLRADGFVPSEISGTDFRMAMGRVGGWQLLKSTAFEVERTGQGYRFRGRGFGHGVGLCVVGAGARSARGATAADILRFYFPTLRVERLGAPAITTTAAARPASPPPAPARAPATPATAEADDVQVALPASEAGERAALVSLVRRSRDAIAEAAGIRAPATIRITVHPTVEAFGRASGQPWWMAGATLGTAIDLLSLRLLSQRGILAPTVRHEIAHALLDAALADRPLWVREGAAIHFSRLIDPALPEPAADTDRGRVACPSDAELLRAVSAGAQRDAYARADACFAKALASGRRWTEVR
ncbi:MAG: SpoIID/LytB domain-containing protein [Vicinamibacterales bacterium]